MLNTIVCTQGASYTGQFLPSGVIEISVIQPLPFKLTF